MSFFYSSGEEIRPGDHVLIHGEPARSNSLPIRLKILMTGM